MFKSEILNKLEYDITIFVMVSKILAMFFSLIVCWPLQMYIFFRDSPVRLYMFSLTLYWPERQQKKDLNNIVNLINRS